MQMTCEMRQRFQRLQQRRDEPLDLFDRFCHRCIMSRRLSRA
jgi:hypothetical protein